MKPTSATTWLDRAIGTVAPTWQLRRVRARIATDLVARHYEAADVGRRTQGWRRASGDANAINERSLAALREHARDLVRNNGLAGQALRTIANHTVGWGILAKPKPFNQATLDRWQAWAESTDCDADGRDNFYGLQKLALRTVAESGEALVRRRWRKLEDGYALPMQIQVLEPDHLDTGKSARLPNGGRIVNGVEFDPLGNRVAYWLFPEHPGASGTIGRGLGAGSRRYDAADVLHLFDRTRAGQVRAVSWFAPILLSAKDLDEYADAQLMKQKIAACLAVITSDVDGAGGPLGTADDSTNPGVDTLEPGAILNVPPGRNVQVVQPPNVSEFDPFTKSLDRRIAKGLGLSYEDYTGDYSQVTFSSARMARIEHYENVYDWRWRLLVPQFCDQVWKWAGQAMTVAGVAPAVARAEWTAPGMAMIEPDKEGLAIMRNARAGIQSIADALRERGYDPDVVFQEIAETNKKLDDLGIVLDSDPRKMTQAGQFQSGDLARQPGAGASHG